LLRSNTKRYGGKTH